MKSIFTLLIVNSIFLATSAQSPMNFQYGNCNKQFPEKVIDLFEMQDCNNTRFGFTAYNQNDSWHNSLETKQSLDSVVTEYYDNDDWIKYNLSEYTYNSKGFNNQSIDYNLNEEETNLTPKYKNNFFFDANGNVTSINHSRRDELTGEWEYSQKREYNYDEDINLVSYVLYGRNESNTNWIPFHKVEFDFDLNGKVIESKSYGWSELNEDWDFFAKEDFTYDENAYLVQRTTYTWLGIDEMRNSRKTEYLNNEDGFVLQSTSFKSLTGIDWVYDSKEELELNFSGLITKVIRADWVDSTNQWIYDIRQDYGYDPQENLNESITFHWNTISNDWLAVTKAELVYNLDFLIDDVLLPTSWPEFGISNNIMPLYKNMLTEVAYFAKVDTTWKIEDRETYYYAERNISAESEMHFDNINIYPNPANDFISIEGFVNSKAVVADLFDLQGRHILTQDVSESNQINVSHLKSGLYLCMIKQGEKVITRKIMIK